MATLTFKQSHMSLARGETVLDCLERHGHGIPSSCRAGVCQSCVIKGVAGDIPAAAQLGLKPAWQAQGYFLACMCTPDSDLTVAECDAVETYPARVGTVQPLAPHVLRVEIEVTTTFPYRAGQFVSVVRPADNLTRPYSIASLPRSGGIELHVAVRPGGRMSNWLAAAQAEPIQLRGPHGECFYSGENPAQPLLLAGTGTGLAPLLGVLRTALSAQHHGPIHLYHGSRTSLGLYMAEALNAMAALHANLRVVHSVLHNDLALPDVREQRLDEVVFADLPKLAGYKVYLCGNPRLVQHLKKRAYLAGADLSQIHSDPFITSANNAT